MTTIRPKVIFPAASAWKRRRTYPACSSGPPMKMKFGMCGADVGTLGYFLEARTFSTRAVNSSVIMRPRAVSFATHSVFTRRFGL